MPVSCVGDIDLDPAIGQRQVLGQTHMSGWDALVSAAAVARRNVGRRLRALL